MNKVTVKKKLNERFEKCFFDYESNLCDRLIVNIIQILKEYFIINEQTVQIKFDKDKYNHINFTFKIGIDSFCWFGFKCKKYRIKYKNE